nr:MAG TPA: hypothetical protein [Caudoviricetes sp.]
MILDRFTRNNKNDLNLVVSTLLLILLGFVILHKIYQI